MELLVAFVHDDNPEMSNVLWCRGSAVEVFARENGVSLDIFYDAELEEPSVPGIQKWTGKMDGSTFLEGKWAPLTKAELAFLVENGCLDIDEEELEDLEEEDSSDDEELNF